MRAALSLLRREADFRRTYLATLVSLGGDWFAVVPLLALLPRLTGGGLAGALVLAADTAVFALLSPYAGTVTDRVDRRRLLIGCELASAVLVLVLLLVHSAGTAWLAVAAIGGVAAAKAFTEPASQAALPNLVERADLRTANVLTGTAWGTMLAVGAALGGLGAAVLGERACFAVDAVSFVASAGLLARCHRPFQQQRHERAPAGFRADVAEALRYARARPQVLALLGAKPGVAFANGALALFPLLAARTFGVGGMGVGLLFAARGLGALLGPLALAGRERTAGRQQRLLGLCIIGSGLAYVGVGFAPTFWLVLVLVTAAHVGGGTNWVVSTYGLQSAVPDRVLGRVASTDYMLVTLAVAANQVLAGVLSGHVATRLLTACFGAASVVYGLAWLRATRRPSVIGLPRPIAG